MLLLAFVPSFSCVSPPPPHAEIAPPIVGSSLPSFWSRLQRLLKDGSLREPIARRSPQYLTPVVGGMVGQWHLFSGALDIKNICPSSCVFKDTQANVLQSPGTMLLGLIAQMFFNLEVAHHLLQVARSEFRKTGRLGPHPFPLPSTHKLLRFVLFASGAKFSPPHTS